MSFAQEGAWGSSSIAANVASTNLAAATFNGSGFELVIFVVTVDVSNLVTGVTLSTHTNLALPPGGGYIGVSGAGVLNAVVWGIWSGASGTPTLTINYTGGNSGANGGKIATGVFTGAAPNIISANGPSASGTGTSATASVSLSNVLANSLTVAVASNNAAHNFSAGAGYSLIFNTSAWAGNVTGYVETTGLSESAGSPTVNMPLTSSTWNMLAVNFPGTPPIAPAGGGIFVIP